MNMHVCVGVCDKENALSVIKTFEWWGIFFLESNVLVCKKQAYNVFVDRKPEYMLYTRFASRFCTAWFHIHDYYYFLALLIVYGKDSYSNICCPVECHHNTWEHLCWSELRGGTFLCALFQSTKHDLNKAKAILDFFAINQEWICRF